MLEAMILTLSKSVASAYQATVTKLWSSRRSAYVVEKRVYDSTLRIQELIYRADGSWPRKACHCIASLLLRRAAVVALTRT
jgi:hypothetical protein